MMRVHGFTLVRDEVATLGVTLRHHFANVCDHIHVVDNGSTDGTTELLRRLARRYPLTWSRDEGAYRQAEVVTEHARIAARQGADWFVPFDADELWWGAPGVRAVLADSDVGALRAPARTFVQRRGQRRDSPRALLSMTHRVETPVQVEGSARPLVERREIAYAEMRYPPKVALRPTAEAAVAKGNHAVEGAAGEIVPTDRLCCLHAPLPSFETLVRKARRGDRHRDPDEPRASWHVLRWHELWQRRELEGEWAANSARDGVLDLDGTPRPLVRDETLATLARPHVPGRARALAHRVGGSRVRVWTP